MISKQKTLNKIKKNVHQQRIEDLVQRLTDSPIPYDTIGANIEYAHGEMDVVATYNDNRLIFEIKTTDKYKTRRKAYNQLRRAEDYFKSDYNVYKFTYINNVRRIK